jgi:acyl-CoA synthetase (AMP-forming)/AMP-acid ligase II
MPWESLVELLEYFRRFGSDTACMRRVGYRMVRWSYAGMLATASRIARELEARVVAKGDRALLWGENSPEWVAAFWGCVLRGAVVVPMDRIAAPDFARRVGDQVQAKLAIGSRQQVKQLSRIFRAGIRVICRCAAAPLRRRIPFARAPPHRPATDYFYVGNDGGAQGSDYHARKRIGEPRTHRRRN